MDLPFEIAGGSVLGQAHAAAGRNNQDAFFWAKTEAALVAVVCDGCSSGAHCEVGAQLGARLVTRSAARRLGSELAPADLLEAVRNEVLRSMQGLAVDMAGASSANASGASAGGRDDGVRCLGRVVQDLFLFTVVGLVLNAAQATLFSVGDGLVVVNGQRRALGPFANNEPPYLTYALLEPALDDGRFQGPRFQIDWQLPAAEVDSILLATDGATDIDFAAPHAGHAFSTDERMFRNPDMLRRRLTILGRQSRGGRFADDTTLVVVRRRRSFS